MKGRALKMARIVNIRPDGTTMPLLIGFDEGRVVALHVQPLMSRRDRPVAD